MSGASGGWLRFALACALTCAIVAPSVARSELPPCGTVTESIRLEGDCIGPMLINASNVVVDLNGFEVNGSSTRAGIQIDAGRRNVKIRDGAITNAIFGMFMFSTTHVVLERLRITDNTIGLSTLFAKRLVVINSLIEGDIIGMGLGGVDRCSIVGNEIRGGSVGLAVSGVTDGVFVNNLIEGSAVSALDSSDPCANRWRNNDLMGHIEEVDRDCIK
jgi:nitrous oxidase accessory protein NosD